VDAPSSGKYASGVPPHDDQTLRIHVSRRILEQKDGPTLGALKRLDANRIFLPAREKDRPDRDRLAARFEQFKARA